MSEKMPHPTPAPPAGEAAQTVGRAIQKLAAARLGRGFVPLALLFLVGIAQMLRGSGGLVLALGAPISAGAMLAYALRVVERAFGRPSRPWMPLAGAAGVVPPAFGLWVLGWLGLRALAGGGGVIATVSAVVLTALGAWVLRAWLKILELHTLAEAMSVGLPSGRDAKRKR
ncbi:MAG: hypothetical protein FIA95_01500 [Gemmatimonadetes bacterium]|nr:hypothetical protein [Gemmatimonadota bacterium]